MKVLARASRAVVAVSAIAAVAVGAASGVAVAFWTATDSSNPGGALAETLPTGATPSATLSGTTATLTFAAAKTSAASGQVSLTSYTIKRYAGTGAAVATSACAPTISAGAATCTISALPGGSWSFTDTPLLASWVGGESAKSGAVSVGATFAITAGQTVQTSAATTLSGGALSGFAANEGITFRLDGATGTVLTGSVSTVDAGGSASGFTVTLPAGVAIGDGTHALVAIGASSGRQATSNSFSVAITPTLALSGTTTLTSLPNTLTAAVSYFAAGESVTFHLDSATGTVLSANGAGSLTLGGTGAVSGISLAVTTPIARGAHTVYAVGSAGSSPSAAPFVINTTSTLSFANNTVSGLTPTLTGGALTSFAASTTVTFHLDLQTGTTLGTVGTDANGSATGFTVNPGVSQGAHTIVATDPAGDQASFAYTEDTLAPSTTDNTAAIGSGWSKTAQTVLLTATDATSGVAATYYTTDGTTPTLSSATYSGGITLSADGSYVIKYFSVDNLGNTEPVRTSGTVKIDRTAPTVTAVAVGPATVATSGFIGGSSYVYANATDALSGLSTVTADIHLVDLVAGDTAVALSSAGGPWVVGGVSYSYRSAAFTVGGALTNGMSRTFTVAAADAAGNASAAQSGSVTVDKTAPTATDNAPAGWQRVASVTVTITPSDTGGSGVYMTYYTTNGSTPSPTNGTSGTSVVLSGDGTYNLAYVVYDRAGNASAVVRRTIQIDRTAPVVSALAIGPTSTGKVGYVSGGVAATVYAEVADATSGVSTVTAALQAGLGTTASVTLSPLATPVTIGATTYNYSGSFTTSSTLTGSSYTFSVTATDVAGNSGTGNGTVSSGDTTAPTGLAITTPARNGTYTGTFAGTAGNDSSGSGDLAVGSIVVTDRSGHTVFQSVSVTIVNGTWTISGPQTLASGPYTVVFTQSDGAGNTTTVQSNFQV